MNDQSFEREAALLLDMAAVKAEPVEQISLRKAFSLQQAYDIQTKLIRHRSDRGYRICGVKLGFTSRAKMLQMGVSDLIFGVLTEDMHVRDGGHINRSSFIHPRVEPEVCFRVSKRIDCEIPLEGLYHYVDGVAAAIELIDSRYRDFKFSLEDVVADNCSSAAFAVGPMSEPTNPLQDLNVFLEINNEVRASGSSNDILDNPWNALQEATRLATNFGQILEPGFLILAGAATSAEFVTQGDRVSAKIDGLAAANLEIR